MEKFLAVHSSAQRHRRLVSKLFEPFDPGGTQSFMHTRRNSLQSLKQARIDVPCSMQWEDLQGDNRVRHCAVCQKNVFNVSDLYQAEAARLFSQSNGEICVRSCVRPDGSLLTKTAASSASHPARRLIAFAFKAGTSIAAVMIVATCIALPTVRQDPVTPVQQVENAVQALLSSLGFSFEPTRPVLLGKLVVPRRPDKPHNG